MKRPKTAVLTGILAALASPPLVSANLMDRPLEILYSIIPTYGGATGHAVDAIILAGILFSSASAVKNKSNVGNAVMWAAGGLWIGLVSFLVQQGQLIFNSIFPVIFAIVILVLTLAPWIKGGLENIFGDAGSNTQWIVALSFTLLAISWVFAVPVASAATQSPAEERAKEALESSFAWAQSLLLLSVIAGFFMVSKNNHPSRNTFSGNLERGFWNNSNKPKEDKREKETDDQIHRLEAKEESVAHKEETDEGKTIQDITTLNQALDAMMNSVRQYANTIKEYRTYINEQGVGLPEETKTKIKQAADSFNNYIKTIQQELNAFVKDTIQEEKDFAESTHKELLKKAREYLEELEAMEQELQSTNELIRGVAKELRELKEIVEKQDHAHEILANCNKYNNLLAYSQDQYKLLIKDRNELLGREEKLKETIQGLAKTLKPLNDLMQGISSSLKKSKKIAKKLHEELHAVGDPLAKGLLNITPAPCEEALKKLSQAKGEARVEEQLAEQRHTSIQNSEKYMQAIKAWEEQGHKLYKEERKELQEINLHASALIEAGEAAKQLHKAVQEFLQNPPRNFKKHPEKAVDAYFKHVAHTVSATAQETHADKNQQLMNYIGQALQEVRAKLKQTTLDEQGFVVSQAKKMEEAHA